MRFLRASLCFLQKKKLTTRRATQRPGGDVLVRVFCWGSAQAIRFSFGPFSFQGGRRRQSPFVPDSHGALHGITTNADTRCSYTPGVFFVVVCSAALHCTHHRSVVSARALGKIAVDPCCPQLLRALYAEKYVPGTHTYVKPHQDDMCPKCLARKPPHTHIEASTYVDNLEAHQALLCPGSCLHEPSLNKRGVGRAACLCKR